MFRSELSSVFRAGRCDNDERERDIGALLVDRLQRFGQSIEAVTERREDNENVRFSQRVPPGAWARSFDEQPYRHKL